MQTVSTPERAVGLALLGQLAVALEDLDQLGAWVLDRGPEVLLDTSAYAAYEAEKNRVLWARRRHWGA